MAKTNQEFERCLKSSKLVQKNYESSQKELQEFIDRNKELERELKDSQEKCLQLSKQIEASITKPSILSSLITSLSPSKCSILFSNLENNRKPLYQMSKGKILLLKSWILYLVISISSRFLWEKCLYQTEDARFIIYKQLTQNVKGRNTSLWSWLGAPRSCVTCLLVCTTVHTYKLKFTWSISLFYSGFS